MLRVTFTRTSTQQTVALFAAVLSMVLAAGCGGDSVGQATRYSIGGSVSGLVGTGLVLQDNNGDNLTISGNGPFTFATPLANGKAYAVTVATQPAKPSQQCLITQGAGTVSGSKVSNVTVVCSTEGFAVGGTVNGLSGSGLVLQNNGGGNLPINSNGAFTFLTTVGSGSPYAVTVKTQPSGPTQTCTVSNGSGSIGNANVSNVVVSCTNQSFTVGGTITGLAGTGLVLQDNGGDDLPITTPGSFTFHTPVANGSAYSVTVKTQPTNLSQTCTVANGTGTVNAAAVVNVSVTCVINGYNITANVVDATASPSGVVLQNNGAGNLNVTGTGSFTFATPVASGQTYNVTVLTQPNLTPAQYCVALNGTGTVTSANVTVNVSCSNVGRYLFVANTYNNGPGNGFVSSFGIDADTGNLAAIGSPVTADQNPSAIALDPSGQFAYVANLNSADITTFSVAAGVLTFQANYAPTAGTRTNTYSVAVSPSGQYAFAGSQSTTGPGGVDAFAVTSGVLTQVSAVTSGNNPLALAVDPAGKFVFASNRYDNNLGVFAIGVGGVLAAVTNAPFATGAGPAGIAVSPGGGYLYVANSGDGTVTAFSYDANTGALSPLASLGSPYASGSGATSAPTGATVDPTGRFLYVTNFSDGTVSAFSIAPLTGQLAAIGAPVATGTNPSDVKVDPSGHYAYVANFVSNTVSIFTINGATGALTAAGTIPAGNASFAIAIE